MQSLIPQTSPMSWMIISIYPFIMNMVLSSKNQNFNMKKNMNTTMNKKSIKWLW